jgi:isoaspartyl peptidase/L-asparaginase-like protein (Ntn-hydrolase superfamily)
MIDGTVECDASIMGGEFGHFGSTGACSGGYFLSITS